MSLINYNFDFKRSWRQFTDYYKEIEPRVGEFIKSDKITFEQIKKITNGDWLELDFDECFIKSASCILFCLHEDIYDSDDSSCPSSSIVVKFTVTDYFELIEVEFHEEEY